LLTPFADVGLAGLKLELFTVGEDLGRARFGLQFGEFGLELRQVGVVGADQKRPPLEAIPQVLQLLVDAVKRSEGVGGHSDLR